MSNIEINNLLTVEAAYDQDRLVGLRLTTPDENIPQSNVILIFNDDQFGGFRVGSEDFITGFKEGTLEKKEYVYKPVNLSIETTIKEENNEDIQRKNS